MFYVCEGKPLVAYRSRSAYNLAMASRNEITKALLLSLGVALLTLVPYIFACTLAQPDQVFSGFLINPLDGFSYLAKMRQGLEGNWVFQLPYTAEPGEGTFLFVYFLFLGHLAKWTGIQLLHLYHLARIVGASLMFVTAFRLLSHFIKEKPVRWSAFYLLLFGAGLGWIGLPFGVLASDLWIVESIPFQTAYANSHFPWATACFLGLIILIVHKRKSVWKRNLGIFFLSTLLALIQPFSILVLVLFLAIWILWETWIEVSSTKKIQWKMELGEKWIALIIMILSALPWLIYDYWLTIEHPQIAAWNAQNKTPSPPLLEFILGFGAPLIVTIVGLIRSNFKSGRSGRLLVVWCIVQGLMIYAPFGLQRRLSLGLYFAIVPIACLTLHRMIRDPKSLRLAILILLLLSIPSNLVVIGSGLFGVSEGDPALMLDVDENESYQWLSKNLESDRLILCGPTAGNRIPAFADLRVVYGHPFETVEAERQKNWVENAYSDKFSTSDGLSQLLDLGVTYVFYGPEEAGFGEPSWLEGQRLIFSTGDYEIYEISNP
jgi:hypothetical protein